MPHDDMPELPPSAFAKEDPGPDLDFYAAPRLVTHIDAAAITALTGFYRRTLPAGGVVLDLMSSWVSHLPDDVAYAEVVGHGMNAEELAANPRLTRGFVQDLNLDPALPLADASLDAAMICVGVQYLQRPAAVLAEVARALKPGAPLVVSFSNRCFPTKAVAVWLALDEAGHARLVELYMRRAGFDAVRVERLADGRTGDPLIAVVGRTATSPTPPTPEDQALAD
jgi:SAM-dependent methyltransferase